MSAGDDWGKQGWSKKWAEEWTKEPWAIRIAGVIAFILIFSDSDWQYTREAGFVLLVGVAGWTLWGRIIDDDEGFPEDDED